MSNFIERVNGQIELLQKGCPLDAIDQYFSNEIVMYDNDSIFARGKEESRKKQEPYILAAKSIVGDIQDLVLEEKLQTVIFRNRSCFINLDDKKVQIDGLCWQRWLGGYVVEERYYSGLLMEQKIIELYGQEFSSN